jgi:hypothetical protein
VRRSRQNLQVLPGHLRIRDREEDFFRLQFRRWVPIAEDLVRGGEWRRGRLLAAGRWSTRLDQDKWQERKEAQDTSGRTEQ